MPLPTEAVRLEESNVALRFVRFGEAYTLDMPTRPSKNHRTHLDSVELPRKIGGSAGDAPKKALPGTDEDKNRAAADIGSVARTH